MGNGARCVPATQPTTVFEGLLGLPQLAGPRGATTNPGTAAITNNNISAINLRSLGQERTLVLLDNHLVTAAQRDVAVNANVIPQLLLQRVDVVIRRCTVRTRSPASLTS